METGDTFWLHDLPVTQKGTVQVRIGLTQKKGTFKICRKSAVVYSSELVVTADLDKNTEDTLN